MTKRIGVIGLGYWGKNILRSLRSVTNAEVVAVADSEFGNLTSARELVENHKAKYFENINNLLDEIEVDAIIIATPPKTHEDLAEIALLRDKHVLVEKPMFEKVHTGKRLTELAISKNLIFMPGHTFMYNDGVLWAKDFIDSGKLGRVLTAYSSRLNLGKLRNDTNAIWNLAPHDVSIFNFLLGGPPVAVSASAADVVYKGIWDLAFITLIYPDNLYVQIHVSWLDPGKVRKFTVIGETGMLVFDDTQNLKVKVHEKYPEKLNLKFADSPSYLLKDSGKIYEPLLDYREPLVVELQNFIDAVQQKIQPRATAYDGILVAAVLNATEESIANYGRQVTVRYE